MDQRKEPVIIFDFGNILINIEYKNTLMAFNKLLQKDWQQDNIPSEVKTWMKSYEVGNMTSENFIWHFQSTFDSTLDPRDIIKAWNALLIGIPVGRIEWLKKLKQKYKIALLSNTNALHLEWVDKHLQSVHGIDMKTFNETCFDFTFYSHIVKLRKPDAEIHELVESVMDVPAKKILFIDDLAKNVLAARMSDWTAVQHRPETKIEDELNTYLEFWEFMAQEDRD